MEDLVHGYGYLYVGEHQNIKTNYHMYHDPHSVTLCFTRGGQAASWQKKGSWQLGALLDYGLLRFSLYLLMGNLDTFRFPLITVGFHLFPPIQLHFS